MRVVYNSFNGRYSDSPRTVHQALLAGSGTGAGAHAHEHLWLVDPEHQWTFPPGVATVPIDTSAAVEALEQADLVLSNSHLEMDWTKRPGATYVQTWHGTPLKRIHADAIGGPPGLLEHLSLDVDRWDVLLSPNRYSTEIMRRAFRWDGEIAETGYPRNDVLLSAEAEAVRDRVRSELGIAAGCTAVLYTPTWRDDAFWEGGPDTGAVAIDLERFTRDLGPDHVLLLRVHYKLTDLMPEVTRHPGVIDVSRHAEVAELYLASDLMVTDYSSTMFDFAVTGKPLIFFTYDLDRYRDELRGFYFDLEADAPGPLAATTAELVRHIADISEIEAAYRERYGRFRQRYCHLEDGHATARVLARCLRAAEPDRTQLPA